MYSFTVEGAITGPVTDGRNSSSSSQQRTVTPFACPPANTFFAGAGDAYAEGTGGWDNLLEHHDLARGTRYGDLRFKTISFALTGDRLFIGGSPGLFVCTNNTLLHSNTQEQVNGLIAYNDGVYAAVGQQVRRYPPTSFAYTVLGNFPQQVSSITLFDGSLYAGTAGRVYRYSNNTWSDMGTLPSPDALSPVNALAAHNGTLYAATGDRIGTGTTGRIFRLDGNTWTDVTPAWSQINPSQVTTTPHSVNSLVSLNGILYAGVSSYNFQTSKNEGYVYAFNGTAWVLVSQTLGTGVNMLAVRNGALYAATSVELLSGAVWSYGGGAVWNFASTFANSVDVIGVLTPGTASPPSQNSSASSAAALAISNVAAANPRAAAVDISWTTNLPADSVVEYGPAAGPPYASSSQLVQSLATNHGVGLAGLSPDTLYHFRVKSRDAQGTTAASGDYTFRTLTDGRIQVLLNGTPVTGGSSLPFGITTVGAPIAKTFTVKNVGSTALAVGSVITVPNGFTLTRGPAATSLAPDQTTTFDVQMAAAALGESAGIVSIPNGDDRQNPFRFTIVGNVEAAPQPNLQVSLDNQPVSGGPAPSDIDYGTTTAGQPVTKTFTVRNAGNAALALTSLTVGGTGFRSAGFGRANVPANDTTSFPVTLTADAAGAMAGTVTIASNDAAKPSFRFAVHGTVQPAVPLLPQIHVFDGAAELAGGTSTVSFGSTTPGLPLSKTFTVRNAGNAALTLGTPSVPTGFTVVTPPASSVAAGGSTTFTLKMTAAAPGTIAGNVSIGHNGTGSPFTFAVQGVVASAADITVFDGSRELVPGANVFFGSTPEGAPLTKTFTIENTGAGGTLGLSALRVPLGFTIVSSFGQASVPPGGSTTIAVRMDAHSIGSADGTLSFTTTVSDKNPYTFRVQGTVGPPAAAKIEVLDGIASIPNSSEVLMGTTPQGSPLSRIFTVKNSGTAPLNLGATITVPSGYGVSAPFGKTSLAPGESTFFAIRLNATAIGEYTGTVFFTDNDPSQNPFTFRLKGTVTSAAIPQINVLADGASIANGGNVRYGSVRTGSPLNKTFTVRNTGNATLTLGTIGVPSGFALSSPFALTSVPPGGSTTFAVRFSAASTGFASGFVSFGTNDPARNPFRFSVDATATP